jgi:hypothetical protein
MTRDRVSSFRANPVSNPFALTAIAEMNSLFPGSFPGEEAHYDTDG